MLVLGVAALVTLIVGGGVVLAARLWPWVDPAAPSGRSVAAELANHPEVAEDVQGGDGPDRVTVLGLSAAALAVTVSVTLFGILLLIVRTHTGFAEIDVGPARWAARHATTASTATLKTLTFLGSTAMAIALLVIVGLAEFRRLPNRAIPAFLILVEGGQLLLHNLIKVLVGRARPGFGQLVGASGLSFPSGHATNAAATFAALALLLGRRRSPASRAALAGAAAGLTALVASTRVLLGVHWVTDVVAGVALGWGWAAVCSIAFGGRILRFGAPLDGGVRPADWRSPPRRREDKAPAAEFVVG